MCWQCWTCLEIKPARAFCTRFTSGSPRSRLDKFSFVEDPRPGNVRKQPTYRMQLLSERMPKSSSAGELRNQRTSSLPQLVSTPSFVNLGRSRPPIVR
eukprot:g22335.t1